MDYRGIFIMGFLVCIIMVKSYSFDTNYRPAKNIFHDEYTRMNTQQQPPLKLNQILQAFYKKGVQDKYKRWSSCTPTGC